uniref:Uncharacterized protein n=1 Tax=Hyaloperonospora arabidopsidis (strain Emoy2) TaxID=559515 RepID=M4BWM5_HYAAE
MAVLQPLPTTDVWRQSCHFHQLGQQRPYSCMVCVAGGFRSQVYMYSTSWPSSGAGGGWFGEPVGVARG